MNRHLQWVREFHEAYSVSQAEFGRDESLADMIVISRQALLMDEGSGLFDAFTRGDMAEILAGLVNLGYAALTGVALRGADVIDVKTAWKHDGRVISIARSISDRINDCASGSAEAYSALYCLCMQLARDFLNADFDKAFQAVHAARLAALKERPHPSKHFKTPDLSDCLFE